MKNARKIGDKRNQLLGLYVYMQSHAISYMQYMSSSSGIRRVYFYVGDYEFSFEFSRLFVVCMTSKSNSVFSPFIRNDQ